MQNKKSLPESWGKDKAKPKSWTKSVNRNIYDNQNKSLKFPETETSTINGETSVNDSPNDLSVQVSTQGDEANKNEKSEIRIEKKDEFSEQQAPVTKEETSEDYGDSFVYSGEEKVDNADDAAEAVKLKKQKSPKTLTLSTAVLAIILTATVVLLAVFMVLYFSREATSYNNNELSAYAAETSVLQTEAESTEVTTQAPSMASTAEIKMEDLSCLNDIGKSLSTLQTENENMSVNPKSVYIYNGAAQTLGEEDGDFVYYFYASNGFPFIDDIINDGYANRLICAGIYTTVGVLFSQTTETTTAQDFFEAINVNDYIYTSDSALEPGLVEFEYNGYLIIIDYSSEISEEDIPPYYIKSSYGVFVIDSSVDNSEVSNDWLSDQNAGDDDSEIDYQSQEEEIETEGLDESDSFSLQSEESVDEYDEVIVDGITFEYVASYSSEDITFKINSADIKKSNDSYFDKYVIKLDGKITGNKNQNESLIYYETDSDDYLLDKNYLSAFDCDEDGTFKISETIYLWEETARVLITVNE